MTSLRIRGKQVRTLLAVIIVLALAVSTLAQVNGKVTKLANVQQFKQSLTPSQKKIDSNLLVASISQANPAAVGPRRPWPKLPRPSRAMYWSTSTPR